MTWIFIEQSDVWLFRDGKPFSAGEEHRAHSLFPPSPMTVQGILRGMFLGHSNADWLAYREQRPNDADVAAIAQQIGHPAFQRNGVTTAPSLGTFSMAGPFLARREEQRIVRFTPLPSDVVREKRVHGKHFALRPTKATSMITHWPHKALHPLWPEQEDDIEAPEGSFWLDESGLDAYLAEASFGVYTDEKLYTTESRFGIAIDYKMGRVRKDEGMLYQAEFIRTNKDVGLLVQLGSNVTLPATKGILAFGGEARGAQYEVIPDNLIDHRAGVTSPTERLKIVLLTPAYLSEGWQPVAGNWAKFFNGQPVRLIAASIGVPQRIGGWDVAHNIPKAMRAYIPAGSVFFFESDQPIMPPAGPITETPVGEQPLDRQGFGQIAVGTWHWLDIP
jgi:CRISPR-associated protein Cmr3